MSNTATVLSTLRILCKNDRFSVHIFIQLFVIHTNWSSLYSIYCRNGARVKSPPDSGLLYSCTTKRSKNTSEFRCNMPHVPTFFCHTRYHCKHPHSPVLTPLSPQPCPTMPSSAPRRSGRAPAQASFLEPSAPSKRRLHGPRLNILLL